MTTQAKNTPELLSSRIPIMDLRQLPSFPVLKYSLKT